MATNWIVPTSDTLAQVAASYIISKANENIDANSLSQSLSQPDQASQSPNWDPALDDRATEQINLAVAQMRGAIQNAGKQPLSVTAGSVPPDALKHVLSLAAYGLVSSTLNLQYVLATEKGDISPLAANFRIANAYLEKVTKGMVVVPPTDPTGRDYINPINVPWGAGPFVQYNPNNPINFPWYGPCGESPFPTYNPNLPINIPYQRNNYPLYDPTKAINPPVEAVRFGAMSRPADLTTFDSTFMGPAPWYWPAGSLGQP